MPVTVLLLIRFSEHVVTYVSRQGGLLVSQCVALTVHLAALICTVLHEIARIPRKLLKLCLPWP